MTRVIVNHNMEDFITAEPAVFSSLLLVLVRHLLVQIISSRQRLLLGYQPLMTLESTYPVSVVTEGSQGSQNLENNIRSFILCIAVSLIPFSPCFILNDPFIRLNHQNIKYSVLSFNIFSFK